MKKQNLVKMAVIAFLSSFVLTMYSTKFKSIIFGVDMPSYFIFGFVTLICGLLLLNMDDIKNWTEMVSKKGKNIKDIPDTVYTFCKKYYFESEADAAKFVKKDVHNKDLANFFVRYVDKNTKEEIAEYLGTQSLVTKLKENSARKVINYNNLFILIGVVASYIYDSNIKGVLLLAGGLSIYNLMIAKNIEKNIMVLNQMNELYKSVSEDILNFKNAKYIMYKCKSILMLDDEYVTVDNLEIPESVVEINEQDMVAEAKPMTKPNDFNIEGRKSALITIGKNKNKKEDRNSKRINL